MTRLSRAHRPGMQAVRTHIQAPSQALLSAVEPVRKVGVMPQLWMQLPPHVDKLARLRFLGGRVQDSRKRACLRLGVPRRLVPVRLRVREIYSTRKPGQHHISIHSHGTGALEGTSALRGDPNGVNALHKAQHRAFLSSNLARGRPEAIAAILHLHQPKDKLKKQHAPTAVGATFRSPVHTTGFFSSRSRMYASKCLFHSFLASSV